MENYDLELDRVVKEIRDNDAKLVCLQLGDGLKPEANDIVREIEEKTGITPVIWLGSCFGACDLPLNLKRLNFDMVIQWGHNVYVKSAGGW